MKIINTPALNRASAKKATGGKTGEGFAAHLNGEGDAARPATSVSGSAGIGAILYAQEMGDALEEKRQALRQGEDLLDQLDKIRLDLLTGSMPAQRLLGLQKMIAHKKKFLVSPALDAVLTDIELRVRVELAKYTA